MAPDLPRRQPTTGSEGSCIEDRYSKDDRDAFKPRLHDQHQKIHF